MAGSPRTYDVVLYGATGFTGELTARELAKRQEVHDFSWAIAGRNYEKLHALKDDLDEHYGVNVDVIVADSSLPSQLDEMARATRVVISTVGPYMQYGPPLVEACVENGTDYIDLTGEGSFVDDMATEYNEEAMDTGARIVNCCGYDSIPADLGTRLTVEQLPADGPIEVYSFATFGSKSGRFSNPFNSISGGTWASAIGFMNFSEPLRTRRAIARANFMAGSDRRLRAAAPILRRSPNEGYWGIPLPIIDVEIVLRSAAANERYGPDFTYGHHAEIPSSYLPLLPAGAMGMGSLFMAAQFRLTRSFLLSLKSSGDGPDAETRRDNMFKTTFLGRGSGKEVITQISGGDPGYGDTSKMLAETALCLVEDGRKTPQTAGVLTPVMATGMALEERLSKSGIVFEVLSEETSKSAA